VAFDDRIICPVSGSQYPGHGPGRDAKFGAEPVLAAAPGVAQFQNPLLYLGAGPSRRAVWTGRTVGQAGLPLRGVAGQPVGHGLAGNAQLRSHVRLRAVLTTHPFDDRQTAVHGQTGISVSHEASGWR
jgi:hypothetical protein